MKFTLILIYNVTTIFYNNKWQTISNLKKMQITNILILKHNIYKYYIYIYI